MTDAASSTKSAVPAASPPWHMEALAWMRANPAATALWGTLVLTLVMFYCAAPLFYRNTLSVIGWARLAWNPETHYEHGPLVPFIALGLVWFALPRLRTLRAEPDGGGLIPLVCGIMLFVLSARTLQPRIAMAGLPLILLGVVLYTFGRKAARVVLFPISCLFFMIPVPGIDQATVRLQLFAAKAAQVLCGLIGIKLQAVGTSLHAVDQSFSFEIAEGCSGINSLMAITLMTAVFAHLTQDRLWKKLLFFAASIPVAIIGNVARLSAIMIVAKVFGQKVAGGWFHDYSAFFISFPFAFGSLCLWNKILNFRLPRPVDSASVSPAPVDGPLPIVATKEQPNYDY